MISRNQNLSFFENYYNKPHWWFKLRYDTQMKKRTCLFLIRKIPIKWYGKIILEIGFGSADVILSFPKKNTLIGAEISKSAIENATKRARKKGIQTFDFYSVNSFPVLDQKILNADLVIASHVLEHVDDDFAIIEQVKKILKPYGYFIAIVPIDETYQDPSHLRSYNEHNFLNICQRAGFKCIYSEKNGELFSIIEPIYWNRFTDSKLSLFYDMLWKSFNIFFCWWPYFWLSFMDNTAKYLLGKRPHQLAVIFQKSA